MITKLQSIGTAGLASVLLLGLAMPASAAIVYTDTDNFVLNNNNPTVMITGNGTDTGTNTTQILGFNLDRFDNTAGGAWQGWQLDGVSITFDTDIQHIGGVTAEDTEIDCTGFFCFIGGGTQGYFDGATVNGEFMVEFTIDMIDPSTQDVVESHTQTLSCTNAPNGPSSCTNSFDTGALPFDGSLDLSGFSLGDFDGANPLIFNLTNYAFFEGSCDVIAGGSENECTIWNTGAWGGEISVAYSATEVPAPGTLALVGLVLAGLGWSRRKAAA